MRLRLALLVALLLAATAGAGPSQAPGEPRHTAGLVERLLEPVPDHSVPASEALATALAMAREARSGHW